MAIAVGFDQDVEETKGLGKALDQLHHQIHMAAARTYTQSFLAIREPLALEYVVILMRRVFFTSAKFHDVSVLPRSPAPFSRHRSAARRQYPMVVLPTVSGCSA